ncbi:MAG: gliding motility-associated C-terminal domain-containing protein [Chitinophagaceae bacterium]|nr:gliding motility-associated C-terminal domain-containing protein [Chitinophagaceae bacterium]
MRLRLLKVFAVLGFVFLFSKEISAQNCIPTNINGAVINRDCSQICNALTFQIPHIKSSLDYTLVTTPYAPYPYNTPTGATDLALYNDDQYSNLINLPFTFCFYGQSYTSAVVGSNGIVTFDPANAACSNAWPITQPIPFAGGTICNSGSTYYPRASIMGAYSDLDPRTVASPATRKIQWEVIGTAPCRKFVVSYYHIGVFGVPAASCPIPANTFQMVMHESTGIIEIFFQQKSCASSTNAGRAILGIQNWNQNQAIAAPGKNNTVWNETNTGYKFIPSAGTSRYVVSELLTMGGALVATADTATTTAGLLDLSFPNVCVAGSSTNFVVRTTYSACDGSPAQLISYDTVTVNLTQMQATITPSPTLCNGASNGSITVTPTTGTAPFSYSLDGAPPVTGPSPYTFNNVTAGNHNVVVTDAFGCITPVLSTSIAAGPPIATTATKTDALCNGSATGTITVAQPSVGTAPFEYSLDGITWQASNIFNGLAAGSYTVYFREGSGCQGNLSIIVAEPTALATSVAASAAICNAQSNGTLIVAANGGVSPYQYSIDGTTWQGSNMFSVPAGNYTITIRDANGCISTQNATVTEPAVLAANSATTNASCDGGNDGTIVVTATGGNNTYTYSIDGINFQPSNQFNVAPGNYTVTVKDNLGCTTSFTTTVGLTNNLAFTQQADPTICESKSTQLQLNSNATQFAWTPATGLSNTTIPNPVANPTVTTQYIVTATLGRCSANDTVVVNVNAAPVPNAGPDGFICYGQNYRLQAAGGGTQYSWSPSTYLDNAAIANPLSTPSKDVVYTLSIISDANGCASLVTDDMRIDVTPPIKVKTFPYDTIGYPGDQFQLLAVPSDSDVINYSWNPSVGLSDPTIPNPVVTVGAIGQDIQYQVITSTIAGCRGEGYVKVRVYKGPDIYVPTGFSPNNDGKNDKFTPFPVGMKSYNYFRVFNRWGQLVFSTTKLNDGWDGRFGGAEQASGVYVWMIEGLTKDNRIITKKGTVMLIR